MVRPHSGVILTVEAHQQMMTCRDLIGDAGDPTSPLGVRTELDPIDQSEPPASCPFFGGSFAISRYYVGVFVNRVGLKQRVVGRTFAGELGEPS